MERRTRLWGLARTLWGSVWEKWGKGDGTQTVKLRPKGSWQIKWGVGGAVFGRMQKGQQLVQGGEKGRGASLCISKVPAIWRGPACPQ